MIHIIGFVWLAVAIILFILETVTMQYISIWFALAAVMMILFSNIPSISLQLLLFAVISFLLLLFTRPMVNKLMGSFTPQRMNADSVIGKIGVVTEEIDNVSAKGRVQVDGVSWRAFSCENEKIAEGEEVYIEQIKGAKLLVKR